jgi:hypothetical protein
MDKGVSIPCQLDVRSRERSGKPLLDDAVLGRRVAASSAARKLSRSACVSPTQRLTNHRFHFASGKYSISG